MTAHEKMEDRLVYDGWVKVFKRRHGKREYDIVKDHNAVAAIITDERDSVLLVRQYRPALKRDTLEIPAGTVDDPSENATECILRELREEAQLSFSPSEAELVLSYKPNVGFSDSGMKLYHIRTRSGGRKSWPVMDEDVTEAVWLGFEELEERIATGEITDVKTIIAYLYLKGAAVK